MAFHFCTSSEQFTADVPDLEQAQEWWGRSPYSQLDMWVTWKHFLHTHCMSPLTLYSFSLQWHSFIKSHTSIQSILQSCLKHSPQKKIDSFRHRKTLNMGSLQMLESRTLDRSIECRFSSLREDLVDILCPTQICLHVLITFISTSGSAWDT